MIDLVVPTIQGREESLARCLSSYQSHAEVNPIVIEDSETCGAGWAKGLEQATAEYVLFACDDQECAAGLDAAIEASDEGFIVCPRVWTPWGTIESNGGNMEEPHHIIRRPQRDRTLVDYTVVPFLTRELAERIGMLADCHYCTDVWISRRGRQLGVFTQLRHGYEVIHHQEQVGRGAGMSQGERDAMDEARMREELAKCELPSPAH